MRSAGGSGHDNGFIKLSGHCCATFPRFASPETAAGNANGDRCPTDRPQSRPFSIVRPEKKWTMTVGDEDIRRDLSGQKIFLSILTRTMSAGRLAAYSAIGCSATALALCLMYVPILLSKIAVIQGKLTLEMDEFKVLQDDIWTQLMDARVMPATQVRKVRQAAPQCTCNSQNVCPPGAPGLPGTPGEDGTEGIPGVAGEKGEIGVNPEQPRADNRECRVCPPGARGPPGNGGPSGPPGPPGPPGNQALPGTPGSNGPPGPPGNPGDVGTPGAPGGGGPPGLDGIRGGKGPNGPPGPNGSIGPKGPSGQAGNPGNAGGPGQSGAPGPNGPAGQRGQPGQAGQPGGQGQPGEDAQYCPCPRRSTKSKN